ncbi:Rap1a/Tai family immunity protein [Chelatococcus sp.]|uniref:Rap1a/Tai family immunity protein n=1 Tax=Chelatococcus sp. TaxID=1953771 RepID=UPI0034467CB0
MGNDIFEDCSRRGCPELVLAFNDMMGAVSEVRNHAPMACVPKHATRDQLSDIFTKYMRDNPSIRHRVAALLYMISMSNAFPCGR